MKRVTVLVTGSRDWADSDAVIEQLERAASYADQLTLVEGGAQGADRIAMRWGTRARHLGQVAWLQFNADWNTHGKAAGGIRNQQMIDYLAQARELGHEVYCLAFPLPASRGTWDAVRRCEVARIPVRIVRPPGTPSTPVEPSPESQIPSENPKVPKSRSEPERDRKSWPDDRS